MMEAAEFYFWIAVAHLVTAVLFFVASVRTFISHFQMKRLIELLEFYRENETQQKTEKDNRKGCSSFSEEQP